MAYEAVIFDRDGVLLDFDLEAAEAYFNPLVPVSLDELIKLWRAYGQEVGFPQTLSEERAFWTGVWDYVATQLELSAPIREKLQQFDYTRILFPYPDAQLALQLSRQHRLRTAVLSNFSLASIDASLKATGLADLVDIAAAAPVIGVAKPQPAAYHYMLRQLDVAPEKCLLFDNKMSHVNGAREVGLQAYLVDRNQAKHDLLGGVVRDLSALSLILKQHQHPPAVV